jgi:hypothetical protein
MAMADGSSVLCENLDAKLVEKNECYTIINADQMERLLAERRRDFFNHDFTLNNGGLRVFRFSDGAHLICPWPIYPDPVPPPGFFCPSYDGYLALIGLERLPIEAPQKAIFEHDIDGLAAIDKNIGSYRAQLAQSLAINPPDLDQATLAKLWPLVKKGIKPVNLEASAKLLIGYAALVSESVRLELNGRWLLKKEYGIYNPFWVPLVVGENGLVYKVFEVVVNNMSGRGAKFDQTMRLMHHFANTKVSDLQLYENRGSYRWL